MAAYGKSLNRHDEERRRLYQQAARKILEMDDRYRDRQEQEQSARAMDAAIAKLKGRGAASIRDYAIERRQESRIRPASTQSYAKSNWGEYLRAQNQPERKPAAQTVGTGKNSGGTPDDEDAFIKNMAAKLKVDEGTARKLHAQWKQDAQAKAAQPVEKEETWVRADSGGMGAQRSGSKVIEYDEETKAAMREAARKAQDGGLPPDERGGQQTVSIGDVFGQERMEQYQKSATEKYLRGETPTWVEQAVLDGRALTQDEADFLAGQFAKEDERATFGGWLKNELGTYAKAAYDATLGMVTGQTVDEAVEQDRRNGAEGVDAGTLLRALAFQAGGQFNDTMLGIGENAVEWGKDIAGLLGLKTNEKWNPLTSLREKNAETMYRGIAPVLENGTWDQNLLMNTGAGAINSAAMMTMGQGLNIAATNAAGGGIFAVNPTLSFNRIGRIGNAAQMAPFALQSATEAYDAAEEQGLNGVQASASAIFAALMSYATNSQTYEDYMQRVGIGVNTSAEMMARTAAVKSMSLSRKAYAWLSDTLLHQSAAEGLQEVAESLTLKLNEDMWAGSFFDIEKWNQWSDEAKQEFIGGYLCGALFNAASLPSYFNSTRLYQMLMDGEVETNGETLAELIVETARDTQSPEGKAALEQAQGMTSVPSSPEQNAQAFRDAPAQPERNTNDLMMEAAKKAWEKENPQAHAEVQPAPPAEGRAAVAVDGDGEALGPVTVTGVSSVENGHVYFDVQNADGTTGIMSDMDVNFTDAETTELLFSGVADRMDARGVDAMLNGYNPAMADAGQYAKEFAGIYSRAKVGMDYRQAADGSLAAQAYLTPEARQAAYEAGYAAYNVARGVQTGATAKFQKAVLDGLNRVTGGKIRLTDADIGANGYYDPETREIVISSKADKGAYVYAAVHEMAHKLKAEHAEAWSGFQTLVKDALLTNGVDVDEAMARVTELYHRQGKTLNAEAALEEVICNGAASILQDEAVLRDLVSRDRTTMQRVADFLREFLDNLTRAIQRLGDDLSGLESWKQMRALRDDHASLQKIYESLTAALAEGNGQERTSADAGGQERQGVKLSVSESFEAEYDAWAKDKKQEKTIRVGTTSQVLVALGAKDQTVIMHSADINHALRHDGMTDEIMKQIPQMMENPIIVMKSSQLGDKNQHEASRVVMYGNVVDNNGAPVIAVLELRERLKGGQILDMQLIKNAYGKDSRLDVQVKKSEILYLDANKKRTNSWLQGLGLQLPSDTTDYGSIGSISYPNGFVKMQGVMYADLLGNVKQEAVREPHRAVTVSSSLAGATSTASEDIIPVADTDANAKFSLHEVDARDVKLSAMEESHYDYSKPFTQQIDDWIDGKIPKNDTLLVCKTPDVFQKVGLSNLPMTIDQTHVDYAVNGTKNADHHMGAEMLKQLPEMLKDPIAIIGSATRPHDSVVVIVQGAVNGHQMMAAVEVDGAGRMNGEPFDINFVSSTQGRKNAVTKLLADAVQKENAGQVGVYYWKKSEARSLYARSGVQFPGPALQDGLIHSIFDSGSSVNRKFMEQTETRQFKRWFGKSKVVNENGSPRVVYHGTNSDFNVFKSQDGAFWFSENEDYAESMAEVRKGSRIIQAYLKMERPYTAKLPPGQFTDPIYERPFIQKAKEEGYDGLILSNDTDSEYAAATFYVVFDPAQIKSATDNVGLFDTKNPDIRYSLRETDETVHEELETLGKAFAMTRGHRITAAEADKLAGSILQKTNSAYDRETLAKEIARIYDYAERADAPSMEQIDDEQTALMARVMEKSAMLDTEHEEAAKPVREKLRTTAISLTDGMQAEAARLTGSLGAFRRMLLGRVRLNQANGTRLDSLWTELSDMAPQWFPADAAEGDMPRLLAEAVDAMKPVYQTAQGFGEEEAAQYMAGELNGAYLGLPGVKAAAKEQAKLGMTAAEYRRAHTAFAESSRTEFEAALRGIEGARKRKALTERQAREAALREKYRKWRERDTVKRRERETRNRYTHGIETDARAMLRLLESPTDKRRVHADIADAVKRFVTALDFSKGTKEQADLKRRIGDLAEVMRRMDAGEYNEGGASYELPPGLTEGLAELARKAEGLGGIAEMGENDLRELSKWTAAVRHAISTANELHDQKRAATVAQAGEGTIHELGERKAAAQRKGVLRLADDLLNAGMVDAGHFFERLGRAAQERYQALRDGFDKQIRLIGEAGQFMEDAKGDMDISKLSGRRAKTQTFDAAGGELTLTRAQMMELYVLSRRGQAKEHLYANGILTETDGADPVRVTERDVAAIAEALTPEERRLADRMQRFLSKNCGAWGNEASMEMYGVRLFGEKDYWPIRVDKNTVDTRNDNPTGQNENGGFYAIKNMGMTKAVQKGASNPLIVGDIFDTFTRHADQMSRYAAYLVPITDMMRWYNYRSGEYGASVKRSVERVFGIKGKRYIEQFVKDINGATVRDYSSGIWEKTSRNAKVAAVGANLRVVVQQPTAYARAAAEMSPKFLAAGLVGKPMISEAKQYCPIALWKSWGFFDVNTGRSMRQMIVGDATVMEKAREAGTWLAGKADEVTWGCLFKACLAEQQAMHPELAPKSEALYVLAGKRLSEIVDRTQVVDSVFHRTEQMRSKNPMEQMYTAFMSEPMKTYNMLRGAIADYAQDRKNPVRRAKLARALGAYLLSGVLTSAAAAVVDAMRSSDEDKDWWEKYIAALAGDYSKAEDAGDIITAALGSDLSDNLNPLGLIPYVKEIFNLIQGYDPSRLDMQSIQRITDVAGQIEKIATGESKWSTYKTAYQVGNAVGGLLGLPVGSLIRDANAIYQTVTGRMTPTMSETASMETAGRNLYAAIVRGDMEKAARLRERLAAGKSPKNPSEIDAAIAKQLTENDERIPQAWEARAAGRAAEVNRYKAELVGEGFTGEMVDKAISLYGSGQEEKKAKDMEKQLNVKLYKTGDMVEAIRSAVGMTKGESGMADVRAIYSELVADSEAKNPEKSVRSEVQSALKDDYLAMEAKGDTRGMQALAGVMREVLGTTNDTLTDWVKEKHSEDLRGAVEAGNAAAAKNAVDRCRKDGRDDSGIKSSLGGFKEKYLDAMKRGNTRAAGQIKTMLKGLGLKGKSGKPLYTDDTFREWEKE